MEAYGAHPSWMCNTSWEEGVGRAIVLGKDLGLQNSNLDAYLLGISFSHQISFMCHSIKSWNSFGSFQFLHLAPLLFQINFKSKTHIWCAIFECMWTPLGVCESWNNHVLDVIHFRGIFEFFFFFFVWLDLNIQTRVVWTPCRASISWFSFFNSSIDLSLPWVPRNWFFLQKYK